jgi:hypothetical protein
MDVKMKIEGLIDKKYMKGILKDLGTEKPTEAVRQGLALLKWALDQKKEGRIIGSCDKNGKNFRQLMMPALEIVKYIEIERNKNES